MVYIIRKAGPDFRGIPPALCKHAIRAAEIPLLEPRPPGFPLLFTSDMTLIEEAVAFLHFHGVQRGRTAETIRTYCEILYDWLETLEQNDIDWRYASTSHLLSYRNRMLVQLSAHTGRRYGISTINHRVRGILRFYRWLYHNQVLDSPLAKRADSLTEFGTKAPKQNSQPQSNNSH